VSRNVPMARGELRTETDSLGDVDVPSEVLWAAQPQVSTATATDRRSTCMGSVGEDGGRCAGLAVGARGDSVTSIRLTAIVRTYWSIDHSTRLSP